MLGACSTSGSSPIDQPENGQTGSPGYECIDTECEASAQDWLAKVDDPARPSFVESRCREANLGPADIQSLNVQHCQCVEADGRVWLVAANGNTIGGSSAFSSTPTDGGGTGGTGAGGDDSAVVASEPCLVWGRGHLGCVFPASATQSCSPSEPGSCEAICARVEQGFAQDAARTLDAEIRFAACRPRDPGGDPRGGRCDQIARINDDCYATLSSGFFGATPYDCSLSDEEIFALRDGR
jgi:hypothetical protein